MWIRSFSAALPVFSSMREMAEVIPAEKIDPGRLGEQQRLELSDKLYQIHRASFSGFDKKAFDHQVVNSPAKETKILLYRNRHDEIVGYFGVHRFDEIIEGRPAAVFRAEAGLLPDYRQRDAGLSFWLAEAAIFKLLQPGTPVYFFFVSVSPSFYALVARYTYKVYPRHNLKTSSQALKLMTHLAHQFGLEPAEEGRPLIRKVGWITNATSREEDFWHLSRNPHIRFYLTANPKFREGNGLLMLIPVTVTNAMLSLAGFAFYTLRKKFRVYVMERQPAQVT